MLWDYLFKEESKSDQGMLFQLKTMLNRKDVKSAMNKSFHACDSFKTIVDAHIIYAPMVFFGMDIPDASPTKNIIVRDSDDADLKTKELLFEEDGRMVDQMVLLECQMPSAHDLDNNQSSNDGWQTGTTAM